MQTPYIFPFGEPVTTVEQADRTPKRVFVLGAYASAVHARWVGEDGETVAKALAVASEPCIFWRGEDAEDIIAKIRIPEGLGKLVPAARHSDGPSANILDDLFLRPLGITRGDAWFCDLVPYSCLNRLQKNAVEQLYAPLVRKHNLPAATLPPRPRIMADDKRREEILSEIREADPEIIILLGDDPIKWFLNHYDNRWAALSHFGGTTEKYGQFHESIIDGKPYRILPVCHPRQAGKLGVHSKKWNVLHEEWVKADRDVL